MVPVRTGDDATKKSALTVEKKYGFVATPTEADADDWREYVIAEIETARRQGAFETEDSVEGVVIALRQDGTVFRRGVGNPPWKTLLTGLKEAKKSSKEKLTAESSK